MKVKVIKDFKIKDSHVQKGAILDVRVLNLHNVFGTAGWTYQITSGQFSGERIPPEYCLEPDEPKLYTEKQLNDLKDHYETLLSEEKEKNKRSNQIVEDFTKTINKKNDEIQKLDFFVKALSSALEVSGMAIQTLKEKEQNG